MTEMVVNPKKNYMFEYISVNIYKIFSQSVLDLQF